MLCISTNKIREMIYLVIIAVGWFITEFEPLQFVIDSVTGRLPKHELLVYLRNAFLCVQCMTLWFGWVYTGSFEIAVAASFMSYVLESWLAKK